jgi:hypothetical protein
MALITLQTFEGSFPLNALAVQLGISQANLEAKLNGFSPSTPGLSEEQKRDLWATVLAVATFESQLAGERDVWELVVDKANAWIVRTVGEASEDVNVLKALAAEVLGGLAA